MEFNGLAWLEDEKQLLNFFSQQNVTEETAVQKFRKKEKEELLANENLKQKLNEENGNLQEKITNQDSEIKQQMDKVERLLQKGVVFSEEDQRTYGMIKSSLE